MSLSLQRRDCHLGSGGMSSSVHVPSRIAVPGQCSLTCVQAERRADNKKGAHVAGWRKDEMQHCHCSYNRHRHHDSWTIQTRPGGHIVGHRAGSCRS